MPTPFTLSFYKMVYKMAQDGYKRVRYAVCSEKGFMLRH